MILSPTSEKRLIGVHPDLVRVVRRTAHDWTDKDITFFVTCGVRTLQEQKLLVAKGASRTLRSRHIPASNGKSHAVDLAMLVSGKLSWHWPLYEKVAQAMKEAAVDEAVGIEWGGDWKTFKDGPHFQLPWSKYPG